MSRVLQSGRNIGLHTDYLNTCLSFGLQSSYVNCFSFAILSNEVVLGGLAGCAILNFTDFVDCHLFAYFLFDFTDNFFHFWLVVVIGWN